MRISIILLLFILVSCSKESGFDKYMRAGKDALIKNNYEEAVKQFDLSLIEEPSNKDALSLFERSKKSLANKIENEKKEQEENEYHKSIALH